MWLWETLFSGPLILNLHVKGLAVGMTNLPSSGCGCYTGQRPWETLDLKHGAVPCPVLVDAPIHLSSGGEWTDIPTWQQPWAASPQSEPHSPPLEPRGSCVAMAMGWWQHHPRGQGPVSNMGRGRESEPDEGPRTRAATRPPPPPPAAPPPHVTPSFRGPGFGRSF